MELDNYLADIWTLSPPCQPYTQGGKQEGGKDTRASSLHRIFLVNGAHM